MSVSHWTRSLATERLALVDVCVVGAGVVGLAAADECSRRGLSVAVVERHSIGWGASTRNAGYLMRGMAESYADIADELGRDTALRVWRDTERNLRLLIERYGIDDLPSFRRVPSSLVAVDDSEASMLERSAAMMQEDGFDVSTESSGDDSLWRSLSPKIALVNPADAAANPAELVARLAMHVRLRSAVLEQAEVFGIGTSGDHLIVQTSAGEIAAERVMVCTNAYAGSLLPALGECVEPNRGQMLALQTEGARLDASYYLDRGSEYIRQAADGTVVVGGMRKRFAEAERTLDNTPTAEVQGALEDFAARALGARGEVIARWAGTMGFTPTGLPMAEPVELPDVESHRVWFCGGFTGHGMSLGVTTACDAVAAMLT